MMPNILRRRCSAFLLIHKDELYLYGGYNGDRKRTSKIEKYNLDDNSWTVIDFRLNCGVERGASFLLNNGEILICGAVQGESGNADFDLVLLKLDSSGNPM